MRDSKFFSMKYLLVTLLLAHGCVMAGGDPMAKIDGGDDLTKVKKATFKETYINPEVVFSFYDSIFLTRAVYDYREVKGKFKSGIFSNTTSRREFEINEEDREVFERLVREAFMEEIVKGKNFRIVDEKEANEKTLIMRGVVMDIVSVVPPSSAAQMDLYMSSVGSATIGLEFLDGSTGEILARVAERDRIGNAGGHLDVGTRPVNRATVIADVKLWARGAARKLRKALDSALDAES